jgi:uncharacterized protein (TIGR00288 family)
MTNHEQRIALLLDYDNIVLGLPKQAKFKPKSFIDRLLDHGKIVIKRAYADWSRFEKDKRVLHELGFDLLDIPKRSMTGKNSADIRMVVDAMELLIVHQHIDTFALVTGDSDFTPLVSALRAHDKYVIGVGVKSSTSKLLIDSSDEFIFYDELVDVDAARKKVGAKLAKTAKAGRASTASSDVPPERRAEGLYLVMDAARGLLRSKDMVWSSMIKQTIVRKHPSFAESFHGYGSFSQMMEDAIALEILEGKRDPKNGNYQVTGIGKAGRELQKT